MPVIYDEISKNILTELQTLTSVKRNNWLVRWRSGVGLT